MSKLYRKEFHANCEVHLETPPHEPCRPGAHVGECGPTGDPFFCACGCAGDETWCVVEADMCCEVDGCYGVKVAIDLCANHLSEMEEDMKEQ